MSILAVAGTSRRLLRLLLSGRHRLFMRLGPRRFLERLYAKSPVDQSLATRPDLVKEYETAVGVLMAQGYDVGILELIDAQRDWGVNLSALTMPITVLHGRQDPLCPVEAMQAWAAENPDHMTLKVLDGVGHYSLAARPDEVIALLQSGTD